MDSTLYSLAELERTVLPQLHDLEQAHYRTFSHPRRRLSWLAGRMLMLTVLRHRIGSLDATALRTAPQGGVQYQVDRIQLSLSHSGELIAVVVSDEPIGLDVEWPRERKVLQRPEEVFSAVEANQLRKLPSAERQDVFYTLWTLKEAACKAAGISLWECLRCTGFDLDAGSFSSRPPFPSGAWHFMSARLESGCYLATAARDFPNLPQIDCRRLGAAGHLDLVALAGQRFLRGQ